MSVQHVTRLETIEHLDFTTALPCAIEDVHSPTPAAAYIVETDHPQHSPWRFGICADCYNLSVRNGAYCTECDWETQPGDPGCHIVEVLR